jgi:hypothetical protein
MPQDDVAVRDPGRRESEARAEREVVDDDRVGRHGVDDALRRPRGLDRSPHEVGERSRAW